MKATLKLTIDPFEGKKDAIRTEKSISVSTEVGALENLEQAASSVFFAQLDTMLGDAFEAINKKIKLEEEANKNQLELPIVEKPNENENESGDKVEKPKRKRASKN